MWTNITKISTLFLGLLVLKPVFAVQENEIMGLFETEEVYSGFSLKGKFDQDYQVWVVKDDQYKTVLNAVKNSHKGLGKLNHLKTFEGHPVIPVKDYIISLLAELQTEEKNKLIKLLDSPDYQIKDIINTLEKSNGIDAFSRQPYRIFASSIYHNHMIHFAMNIFSFYYASKIYRTHFPDAGVNLAGVLLFSSAAASVGHAIVFPKNPALGASGAIFGMLGYDQSLAKISAQQIAGEFVKDSLISEAVGRPLNLNVGHDMHLAGLLTGILIEKLKFSNMPRLSSNLVTSAYALLITAPFICSLFAKNKFKYHQKFISNPYPGILYKLLTVADIQ